MAKFRPNLGQFWPKWVILNLSRKWNHQLFSTPDTRLKPKKLQIRKNWLQEKCKKHPFVWNFGSKWPILDSFWPKWAKLDFFSKKHLKLFLHLQALNNLKDSEKSNEGIPRKKIRKTPFLGILAQNGQFWKFLAKTGDTPFSLKKST